MNARMQVTIIMNQEGSIIPAEDRNVPIKNVESSEGGTILLTNTNNTEEMDWMRMSITIFHDEISPHIWCSMLGC